MAVWRAAIGNLTSVNHPDPPGRFPWDAIAEIYRTIPQPRDDDMVRIEVGERVMDSLRVKAGLPYGFLPPILIQGIPVVVQPDLDPRTVRVISRAGEVLNEWETPA